MLTAGRPDLVHRGRVQSDLVQSDLVQSDLVQSDLVQSDLVQSDLVHNSPLPDLGRMGTCRERC
jgi:hypothetical protein